MRLACGFRASAPIEPRYRFQGEKCLERGVGVDWYFRGIAAGAAGGHHGCMAIYESTRNLSVKTVSIYCDGGCGRSLDTIEDLATFQLVRLAEKRPWGMSMGESAQLYEIPGVARTEPAGMQLAASRGWLRLVVHGKPLDFCSSCKMKDSDLPAQPSTTGDDPKAGTVPQDNESPKQ